MVAETVVGFMDAAAKKVAFLDKSWSRYFLLSLLAGFYVGLGIILVFSVGAPLAKVGATGLKALMGVSFGVALILVIFAGSELFTGNNLILTIGGLGKKVSWLSVFRLWTVCYIGNLFGSLLLALIVFKAGMFDCSVSESFIAKVSLAKGSAPFSVLFMKGILCNILVCLAVWTAARTKNDMAKISLIFWCLFAFIGSGYEHSIANMTVIGVGLLVSDAVTWSHFGANILPVTLGNMVGGMGLGMIYWFISNKDLPVAD